MMESPDQQFGFPETVASVVDFERLLAHPGLILFAHAGWSGPSFDSRATILQAYNHLRVLSTLPLLAEVDITDDSSTLHEALQAWLSTQPVESTPGRTLDHDHFMTSGAGNVAWIRHGKLVGWTINAHASGIEDLVARSISALDL